ncbi:hypothetical protein HDU85_002754 [Gaertneriomyces sp. JEL0708]|nr:hypothetical protein HDU85_002754 [Gaertneriomyces sp. JEL0708]
MQGVGKVSVRACRLAAAAGRVSCARSYANEASARKVSPTKIDVSKAASVLPQSPHKAFASELRKRRKQYALESQKVAEKQREKEARRKMEEEERMRELDVKIKEFKKERAASLGDGLTGSASESTHPASKALGAASQEQEDPFITSRRNMWRQMTLERRQKRYNNHLQALSSQSEHRLTSLLHLYHSASSFVTYENLDAKLDQVQDLLYSFDGSDLENAKKELITQRTAALQEAITGSILVQNPLGYMAHPGLDDIKHFKDNKKSTENTEAEVAYDTERARLLAEKRDALRNAQDKLEV